MSTLTYAAITSRREDAEPGTSATSSPPGIQNYIDALAALVPAEVLAAHAVIVSATTRMSEEAGSVVTAAKSMSVTKITDPEVLAYAFYGLIALSMLLYVLPRLRKWDGLDFARVFIPAGSFVAWTMIQRSTAFDAVAPHYGDAARTVSAVFAAILLGALATWLSYQADKKTPER